MERNGESPELVINQYMVCLILLAANLGNDALNGIEIGTIWNEWQDNWVGRPVDVERRNIGGVIREQTFGRRVFRRTERITTIQQVNQSRTGIRQVMVPQVVRNQYW